MRVPLTLSFYIGRHFFTAVLLTIGVMILLVGLTELLDLVRRAAGTPRGLPFHIILELAMLKLPTTAEKIYPFAFLIGGMITLARLTRTSELVVARSAGVSVWQFLLPGVVMSLAMGIFFVCLANPLAAATSLRYNRIQSKYLTHASSTLTITASGLWLRQVDEEGIGFNAQKADEYILHASSMDQKSLAWQHVVIFLFEDHVRFIGRIDADSATLSSGKWTITNATLSAPGFEPQAVAQFDMPTQLTMAQVEDSFAPPETFSFWQLPAFISVLERSGFSALHHRLHYHSLVAMPVLLAGMLMLAAVFTLRLPRRGRTGTLITVGLVTGFFLYFATNIIYALGAAGHLPIVLAAWAPSLLVVAFASAALLHLEDG
ncbi:MAG: LPS export ABC transporter permease LptG [Alphaproteobacteria bacterium]